MYNYDEMTQEELLDLSRGHKAYCAKPCSLVFKKPSDRKN